MIDRMAQLEAMPNAAAEQEPVRLRMRPVVDLNDNQFFDFCQLNRDLRIERTANGEILIMPPTGYGTGRRNAGITAQLHNWAEMDGSGEATDSSCGFRLPNGATRAPDAAWILKSRLAALSGIDRERFLPLCPDFVIELRSSSDRLADLQLKMKEYMASGARLGWLIDPFARRVIVYRPGAEPQRLDNPLTVSADPELPGFALDLRKIW
jgi:Uma2 family endonuclease